MRKSPSGHSLLELLIVVSIILVLMVIIAYVGAALFQVIKGFAGY